MPADWALAAFDDRDGLIAKWPARRRAQLLLLSGSADHFDSAAGTARWGSTPSSMDWTALATPPVSAALCNLGYIGRERDGSAYRLITTEPPEL